MIRCPKCGREQERSGSVGDLETCGGCRTSFWAVEGSAEGRLVAPREKAPPGAPAVLGLHLGVLLAQIALAAAVLGLGIGLPVWGLGRLFGLF
jgi:hypothetical protein